MNQRLTHSYQNDTRRTDDFYRTPDWCADIGAKIAARYGGPVLDPCAGDGSIMQAVERAGLTAMGIEIDGARSKIAGAVHDDALARATEWPAARAVLMNPPFSLWQQFLVRAKIEQRRCVAGGSTAIIALLRLGAMAGQKRREWWLGTAESHGITVHVLSKRPSFTGKGTDGTDYAWVEFSSDVDRRGVEWV